MLLMLSIMLYPTSHQRKVMRFTRTPDKNVYLKIIFLNFFTKLYVVGTQKNSLNEIVLLSTQNLGLN